MIQTYMVNGEVVDSLDLKVMLVGAGICVDEELCAAFARTHRVPRNRRKRRRSGTLLLPDRTVVGVADNTPQSPFRLTISAGGTPCLTHGEEWITEVSFPPATALFEQTTSRGVPFAELAALQGWDVLALGYLWPCVYAKARLACKFCHCGNHTQEGLVAGRTDDIVATAQDVAEIIHYGVNVEKSVRHIQITAGSTFNASAEIDRYVAVLRAVDNLVGRENIPGELLIYTTPPKDPREIDKLFAAGVGRVLCDMEAWSEEILGQIAPAKARWIGAQRALDTLLYIARTHGPNRACSEFVTGVEPVESVLAGAEFLASHGVVPIPSIWFRHGTPEPGFSVEPGLEYFRQLRLGFAAIYQKYQVEPFGDVGFNVNFSRDIWNHREEILQAGQGALDASLPLNGTRNEVCLP